MRRRTAASVRYCNGNVLSCEGVSSELGHVASEPAVEALHLVLKSISSYLKQCLN